ncbi:MBL fold metallo-hydrolase [Ihubacter sp. mB4P-1]|uniref:MBL fold metallo-hydrolase n=1 Tax=Ihubacter sp. mB4P-1 TaxID=3242370 RepID=UPI003C7D0356
MKLQVLVDNNTYIDAYYLGEPAASFYIEEDGKRILLDTGYSDILLGNAKKMDIDLSKLTHIVFSHGHNDHTRGFSFLKEKIDLSQVSLIAHPDCFLPREDDTDVFGAPFSAEETAQIANYAPSRMPVHLTEKLVFLGEIPRRNDFEAKEPIGRRLKDGLWEDDFVMDDSALVYQGKEGLFIISGCSHSGICNIIEYAKEVCGDARIAGVIGGFHLFETGRQMSETIRYLKECGIEKLYPCHCVSLTAKAAMLAELPVTEVGVGLRLEIQ